MITPMSEASIPVTVLYVDDEPDSAETIAAGLEREYERLRVETAESVAEGSGNDGAADVDRESAWRQRSVPTPLTAVEGFDDEVVTTLRKAGIGSVRRLATADPDSVADALELGVERVRAWRDRAREHESSTER